MPYLRARIYSTILIYLVSMFLIGAMTDAYAAEDREYLSVSVNVLPASTGQLSTLALDETGYGIAIEVDPLSVNMGDFEADSSGIPQAQFNISCFANSNNHWELFLKADDRLSSGLYYIPLWNISWAVGSGSARGELTGSGTLDTTETIFYKAAMSEYNMSGPLGFDLTLTVSIPNNQAAGYYTAPITIGMRDTYGRFPETEMANVEISLEILPRLNISLSEDAIDFGTFAPGISTDVKNITVSCISNNYRPWSVSLEASSPLVSGINEIPNANFLWSSDGGSYRGVSAVPYFFYDAQSSSYITNDPVEVDMSFYVDIPKTQPGGQYESTLLITILETPD